MFSNKEKEYIKHVKAGYMIRRPDDEPREGFMCLSWGHERVLVHRIHKKVKATIRDLELIKGTEFERWLKAWQSGVLKT